MADWHKSPAVQATDKKERDLEEKRKQVLEASKFDPYNQRYGLFSFPGPLHIGDNTAAEKLLRHRNPNGSVTTQDKNFLTQPLKSGTTPEAYFSTPSYHPDLYSPPTALKSILKPLEKTDFTQKAGPFHPSGAFKEHPVVYEYQSSGSQSTPNLRGKGVLPSTGPKNFLTRELKKGHAGSTPGLTLGQEFQHLPDPYERKEEMARQERAREKAKAVSPGPFRGMGYTGNNFSSAQDLYSEQRRSAESLPRTNVRSGGHLPPGDRTTLPRPA